MPMLDPAVSPTEIEARSFAIIEAEVGEPRPFTGDSWSVARRLVHSSGDLGLLDSLYLPEDAIDAGVQALRAGCPVFTDTEMVRSGIPARRTLALGVEVSCFLAVQGAAEDATRRGITRARAGMEALGTRLGNAVVAIGNAPTALLALLELLDNGAPKPALIIGMPVGFVNAAESKDLLIARQDVPCVAILGRRGGSPLAAATVNALFELAITPCCLPV
ncbi:precorrin-8X methylmutase [Desulfovibrio sp. OttesenSCG-928-F20]|nr:precorrin-8X methylmutase [Desulfovibrio sp. OttesenSCG-928-F20]